LEIPIVIERGPDEVEVEVVGGAVVDTEDPVELGPRVVRVPVNVVTGALELAAEVVSVSVVLVDDSASELVVEVEDSSADVVVALAVEEALVGVGGTSSFTKAKRSE